MATARLTEGRVKALRQRKTVQDIRDVSLKGFGIRVYPTGRKRYFSHEGLSRPRTRKGLDHVWRSIGRISERSRGIAQHYKVDITADPQTGNAMAVTWEKKTVAGTMLTHPGVWCLRTNAINWDQETLWRTYTMLTGLEAVFRSLKSELGLRPIYHQTRGRSDGHLFITVLVYQLVQTIRRRLREAWRDCKLGHPAPHSRRPAACHRHVPPQGWQVPARAQGNVGRARSAADLHRARSRSAAGQDLKNGRLITATSHNGPECSARHSESALSSY